MQNWERTPVGNIIKAFVVLSFIHPSIMVSRVTVDLDPFPGTPGLGKAI